jgi:predicted ester cyclase
MADQHVENLNRLIFRRFCVEIVSRGDLDLIDELIAADLVHHGAYPLPVPGPAGIRMGLQMERRSFPDHAVRIDKLVAENDLVTGLCTITGTHTGEPFMGIAPSGRSFTMQEAMTLRINGGQIVELWAVVDVLTMMLQLGAVSIPITLRAEEAQPGPLVVDRHE